MFIKFNWISIKTLVSNCTALLGITNKCVLSTAPATNTSCNINSKQNHTLLCHIQIPHVKLFYIDFQIINLSNVNSNDKHILQVSRRPFFNLLKQMLKNIYFKIEDSFPLEDRVLSNWLVHSSCIYKSKYGLPTYREKAPHLSYDKKTD